MGRAGVEVLLQAGVNDLGGALPSWPAFARAPSNMFVGQLLTLEHIADTGNEIASENSPTQEPQTALIAEEL